MSEIRKAKIIDDLQVLRIIFKFYREGLYVCMQRCLRSLVLTMNIHFKFKFKTLN